MVGIIGARGVGKTTMILQYIKENLNHTKFLYVTLESDIPQYANLNVGTNRKLKRLLSIIAESVPFKPNFSKIAGLINVNRNSLDDYFSYIEKAGLISQLRNETIGIRGLGKVDKVYLDNTIGIYTFEIGGKNKQQSQIEKDDKSYVVKDDIEFGYLNVIPLWTFGLNY